MKYKFKDQASLSVAIMSFLGLSFIFSLSVIICTWNIDEALNIRILFSVFGILCLIMFPIILYGFISTDCCISDSSISQTYHGKNYEIQRDDIILIADVYMGKERYFVIYPKSISSDIIDKQLSIYETPIGRLKLIRSDNRIIFFAKTKKTEKYLKDFGYSVKRTVD